MRSMKIGLATVMLLVMVGTAAANPGISMTVTPQAIEMLPGETATYEVTINYFLPDPPSEHVVLSIDNPIWGYTYDPAEFDINSDETKSSTLTIQAPLDASQGIYEHTVRATATAEIIINQFLPPLTITEPVTTTIETTLIPEFTSIAIPVIAILGLFVLVRRRK